MATKYDVKTNRKTCNIFSNAFHVCACMDENDLLYVLCIHKGIPFQYHYDGDRITKASHDDIEYLKEFHRFLYDGLKVK